MLCWGQDAVAMQESEGLLNGWRLTLLMKHAFQNPFYSLKISRVYNLDLCTPLSPLTPLVPHPITWSSHLHVLSYCCFFFLYNQTESNKQLPSSHTLEANFPSSPRCQELFSLEVEPHKPLPHSSWDYWPVWTCAGNCGHREFMSPAPMSGPGDSVSQSSSTFPSSCTKYVLETFMIHQNHSLSPWRDTTGFHFPSQSPPEFARTHIRVWPKKGWQSDTGSFRAWPTHFPWTDHPQDQLPHLPVERLQAFPSPVQIPHPTQRQQLRGAQCQEKQASGVRPRTLRAGEAEGRHHRYHCWCPCGDHFGI